MCLIKSHKLVLRGHPFTFKDFTHSGHPSQISNVYKPWLLFQLISYKVHIPYIYTHSLSLGQLFTPKWYIVPFERVPPQWQPLYVLHPDIFTPKLSICDYQRQNIMTVISKAQRLKPVLELPAIWNYINIVAHQGW